MTKNGFFVTTPTPTIGKNTRKGLVFQSLSAFLNGQNFWHLKGVLPILCFLCLSSFSILEPINARMPVCRGCAGDITRFIHPNVSDACKASLLSSSLFLPCFVVPQYFPTWLRNPLESTPVPWSCNGVHPLELEMHCYTFHCCLRCIAACIQWGFGTAADAPPAQERKCFELKKVHIKNAFLHPPEQLRQETGVLTDCSREDKFIILKVWGHFRKNMLCLTLATLSMKQRGLNDSIKVILGDSRNRCVLTWML